MFQYFSYEGPVGKLPYYVYTPVNYSPGKAVPLIVMLHGCTQKAEDLAASTHMNRLADEYQFIVVYPQQVKSHDRYFCWNWFEPAHQSRGSGEPALIAGIVQSIKQGKSRWMIDERRVYGAGISAGAALSVIQRTSFWRNLRHRLAGVLEPGKERR